MSAPSSDRFFSVGQLADQLALSARSVRRLLPMIGFVRVGRAIRVPQTFLETYLQSQSVPPLEGSTRCRGLVDGEVSFLVDRVVGRHRHKKIKNGRGGD